ncbi:MAG: DUF3016 domain-containing protein [Rubrivivax sp.]|nr:DUF3016 domain-containing protein [Rubrivivax sp.]
MSHALRTTLVAAGLALLSAALLVALARPAHAAGSAEVRFVEPERFSDAGRSAVDRERALASLAAHLKELARKLPDGQALKVEVLDVDLAGELWPRRGHDVRVLRGSADAPHVRLRWTLEQAGSLMKKGEQHLSDLGYLTNRPGLASGLDSDLPYEKRLLTQWFREQVEGAR